MKKTSMICKDQMKRKKMKRKKRTHLIESIYNSETVLHQ